MSINIFYKGGDVHAILRNPYRSDGGAHHAGNKMALDNVRERLALHFDAEAALESQVARTPTRSTSGFPTAGRADRTAGAAAAREPGSEPRRSGRYRRSPPARGRGIPWLMPRCAS